MTKAGKLCDPSYEIENTFYTVDAIKGGGFRGGKVFLYFKWKGESRQGVCAGVMEELENIVLYVTLFHRMCIVRFVKG